MSKIAIIKSWSTKKLIEELRSPLRESCSPETYLPLLVEAIARILENTDKVRRRTI